MLSKTLHIVALLVLLLPLSCKENIGDRPQGNQPPKTFLWLYPDSTIGVGVSRQHLRWWGEDPDGFVRGFLFAFDSSQMTHTPVPDTLRYTWVTTNDTVIQFPLHTLFSNFAVFVRAVDNTFDGLPNQSIVRLSPGPYADNNGNGIFDAGDLLLPGLAGAMDPTGAHQVFPIRNTPPSIAFAANPNDPTSALRLPDTTYTAVSIGFIGSDPDGDNTLSGYRIALNDTTSPNSWFSIPLRDTIVTLVVPRSRSDVRTTPGDTVSADVYGGGSFLGRHLLGRVQGLRLDAMDTLYVEAKDIAGEYSLPVRLPSGTGQWFVKRPKGNVLLVQDYTGHFDIAAAQSTYLTALGGVGPSVKVDLLNIAFGVDASAKKAGRISAMVPPFIDPALINTFLLFDYVFIYTDEYPTIKVLQLVPFPYIQNGGKLLLSTYGFASDLNQFNISTVLKEFAPIDSVCSALLPSTTGPVPGFRFVPPDYPVMPDSSVPTNIYPVLAFYTPSPPSNHLLFFREVYKRTDARVIYRLKPDSLRRFVSVDPSGGSDTVGVKVATVDGQGTIIYFALPLHLLYGPGPSTDPPTVLTAFFTKAFTQHFNRSPFHRINRRKF